MVFRYWDLFFISYLGEIIVRKKCFRKKYFLDRQTFLQYEGQDPVSEEKIRQTGEHQKKIFHLAQRLGNSPISFGTETTVLTNGDETFHQF